MGFPFLQKNDRFLRCEKSKGRQGGTWGGETPASNVQQDPSQLPGGFNFDFFFFLLTSSREASGAPFSAPPERTALLGPARTGLARGAAADWLRPPSVSIWLPPGAGSRKDEGGGGVTG